MPNIHDNTTFTAGDLRKAGKAESWNEKDIEILLEAMMEGYRSAKD